MKIIYVAGPYRADTIRGMVENIRRAEAAALHLWKAGWAVICPHKNTELFDGHCADDVWLRGDLAILSRCDAVYMLNGWENSEGATEEHRLAQKLGLTVMYQMGEGDIENPFEDIAGYGMLGPYLRGKPKKEWA